MSIHLIQKCLVMSILFCNFALELKRTHTVILTPKKLRPTRTRDKKMNNQSLKSLETAIQIAIDSIVNTTDRQIRTSCITVASEIENEFIQRANNISKLLNSKEAWNIRSMSYGEKFNLLHEKRRELYSLERFYWKAASTVHNFMSRI